MAVNIITVDISRSSNIATARDFSTPLIIVDKGIIINGDTNETFARVTSITQLTKGTASDDDFMMIQNMVGNMFEAKPGVTAVYIFKTSETDNAMMLADLKTHDDGSWFSILYANSGETTTELARIRAIASWVSSNNKFFYCIVSGDEDSNDAPSILQAKIVDANDPTMTSDNTNYIGSYSSVACLVHNEITKHPEAIHLARYLASGIGLSTPAPTNVGARLEGVLPNSFSIAKNDDIIANKGNVYVDIKGINQVNNALATNGTFWSYAFEDAWIVDRVETDLTTFLASRPRTSYTNREIIAVSNVVSNALRQAGDRNMVDLNDGNNSPDYTPTSSVYKFGVYFPTRQTVASNTPDNIENGILQATRVFFIRSGNITSINLTVLYSEV